MILAPIWRNRLFASVGATLAVVFGVLIANESFFWPMAFAGALAGLTLIYIQSLPLTALLLGGLTVGYIVGNRGFAQISLAGNFPLLPAEFVLLVGGSILAFQSAWRRDLPFRRDLLNATLLVWMLIGSLRVGFDVKIHGLAAIRDYALVYYGAFFFLAQHVARDAAAANFVRHALLFSCGALLVVHPLYLQFQDFFLNSFTLRGVPLIYFKGDLAGNFMAVGSLLYFMQYERTRSFLPLVASLALAGMMITTESRSSLVGLAVGAAWLGWSGRWRFALTLGAAGCVVTLAILVFAYGRNESWQRTPLHQVYERVMSIADPMGRRAYQSEENFKADNNVFRMVWWKASIEETLDDNRWFGLGFGHDLAARFVRQYYPEGHDDFTARSPHNVLITVFARMGFIGLATFLAVIWMMMVQTHRALRNPALAFRTGPYWCAAWVLLVSACLGVFLEGPMGAMIFWTTLGLANAGTLEQPVPPSTDITLAPAALAAVEAG